jgi:hypothetical protein
MKLLLEHLPVSFAIGLVGWWFSGDWVCLAWALTAGWLVDADHLVDFTCYLWHNGRAADWRHVSTGLYFKLNGRVMVPLHAWEISIFLAFMATFYAHNPWPWACAALAHGVHLWHDQNAYRVRKHGYWLVSRIGNRFTHDGFCR